jgi:hypothetical protein
MLSPEHVGRISPQRQVQATHQGDRIILPMWILINRALDGIYAYSTITTDVCVGEDQPAPPVQTRRHETRSFDFVYANANANAPIPSNYTSRNRSQGLTFVSATLVLIDP